MIEEILPGLYRIEVPLPRSPLKYLNSYVIRGDGRYLIVDTGMNRPECLEALTAGLNKLSVDLNRADIFITHVHSDHAGLCGIAAGDSRVYISEVDSRYVMGPPTARDRTYRFYVASGFPEAALLAAVAAHPGRLYAPRPSRPFTFVKDGDPITMGDYSFRCVVTPGHTPEHMCLYDSAKKILVCGDHLLVDITPNITTWEALPNSLQHYLDSLDKVYSLDVGVTLPGHRRLITDHRRRIDELKAHHQARAGEVLRSLEGGPRNVYEVAPHITWDIQCESWEAFPVQQKWFAFGETLAHLQYLQGLGKVRRIDRNGQIAFGLV